MEEKHSRAQTIDLWLSPRPHWVLCNQLPGLPALAASAASSCERLAHAKLVNHAFTCSGRAVIELKSEWEVYSRSGMCIAKLPEPCATICNIIQAQDKSEAPVDIIQCSR
jgi:hypothetical protein